jgi:hypothetical protein
MRFPSNRASIGAAAEQRTRVGSFDRSGIVDIILPLIRPTACAATPLNDS